MFRKSLINLLLMFALLPAGFAQQGKSSALVVGGNFSEQTNFSSKAPVFDRNARDAEVAILNGMLKNRKYSEVIRRINDLISKNYLDKRFYLLLAIAYDGLGKTDDVIYSAGEAIAVAPQDPRAYILRAGAYLQRGSYERCRIDIDKALALNPNSKLAAKIKKELDEKTFVQATAAKETPAVHKKAPAWNRQGLDAAN